MYMNLSHSSGCLQRLSALLACQLLLVVTAGVGAADSADTPNAPAKPAPRSAKPLAPSLVQVADDAQLPRVLLIGDSISMGYTLPVRELLKGKANVHRPPTNCGDTARALKDLDKWLGEGKWDVIHFNFGLHDLKYLDASGKYVDPTKGRQVASLERYEKNLRDIVARLQKTGATLIWASTTPVPDGSAGRVQGDEVNYNKVAARVMKDNGNLDRRPPRRRQKRPWPDSDSPQCSLYRGRLPGTRSVGRR